MLAGLEREKAGLQRELDGARRDFEASELKLREERAVCPHNLKRLISALFFFAFRKILRPLWTTGFPIDG